MSIRHHHRRAREGDRKREGFALVSVLLVVLVLSVLAVGVAWLAGSEKKTSFAESVHLRSVMSADAGSEAAINFIRMSETPPQIVDFADNSVQAVGTTTLQGSQSYNYECWFDTKQLKPGWGFSYLDYTYRIRSQGTASLQGESGVGVVVSNLYKEGY